MRQVQALLLAIGLAATACSSDSDATAEVEAESPTTTESSTTTELPTTTEAVTESVAVVAETETDTEAGDGNIAIETEIDFADEPYVGTFVVDEGAELLGCSSGSVLNAQGVQRLVETFTCEDGDREGTFTFVWMVDPRGSEGPGDFNGPWSVLDATGDFAGLTGDGLWSGVLEDETGLSSFPGTVEFGPAGPASTDADATLIDAVVSYAEAFGLGDADLAWSMVSARCQGTEDETEYREDVASFAVDAPGLTASDVSAVVVGDTAAVSYDTSAFRLSYVAQPWILVDGEWYWDNCD